MPPVNGVGEPWAREPHARFEVAGAGNGVARSAHTTFAGPSKCVDRLSGVKNQRFVGLESFVTPRDHAFGSGAGTRGTTGRRRVGG